MSRKFKVVTICGSVRFKKQIRKMEKLLTNNGCIVLSLGAFRHYEDGELSFGEKEMLNEMHKEKIKMSDIVFVVDKGGYIGKSTEEEISYAKDIGKQIIYYSAIKKYRDAFMDDYLDLDYLCD